MIIKHLRFESKKYVDGGCQRCPLCNSKRLMTKDSDAEGRVVFHRVFCNCCGIQYWDHAEVTKAYWDDGCLATSNLIVGMEKKADADKTPENKR